MRDISLLKGGNWQDWCYPSFMGFTKWVVQWEHVPYWSDDMEGLPERWVKISMREVRWGSSRTLKLLLDAPTTHCVKEDVWI